MRLYILEVSGYRLTMEAVGPFLSGIDDAVFVNISEQWAAAVRQSFNPPTEPTNRRFSYNFDSFQTDLVAPGATGVFPVL